MEAVCEVGVSKHMAAINFCDVYAIFIRNLTSILVGNKHNCIDPNHVFKVHGSHSIM